MKKVLSLLITIIFILTNTGQSYALRPISTAKQVAGYAPAAVVREEVSALYEAIGSLIETSLALIDSLPEDEETLASADLTRELHDLQLNITEIQQQTIKHIRRTSEPSQAVSLPKDILLKAVRLTYDHTIHTTMGTSTKTIRNLEGADPAEIIEDIRHLRGNLLLIRQFLFAMKEIPDGPIYLRPYISYSGDNSGRYSLCVEGFNSVKDPPFVIRSFNEGLVSTSSTGTYEQMISRGFVCEKCGYHLENTNPHLLNHCPECLWSKHLTGKSEDTTDCEGLMEPVGLAYSEKARWHIRHRCQSCGEISYGNIRSIDNRDSVESLAADHATFLELEKFLDDLPKTSSSGQRNRSGFGMVGGSLTEDERRYKELLTERISKEWLTLERKKALINALVRLKSGSLKIRRGEFFEEADIDHILLYEPFNLSSFLDILKDQLDQYESALDKKGKPLFSSKQISDLLFKKLIPFSWVKKLLEDDLSKAFIVRILSSWAVPLKTWQTLKPIRDELIESGLSPTDATQVALKWSNPKETWDTLKPIRDELVEDGLPKTFATKAVLRWSEPKETWDTLKPIRDRMARRILLEADEGGGEEAPRRRLSKTDATEVAISCSNPEAKIDAVIRATPLLAAAMGVVMHVARRCLIGNSCLTIEAILENQYHKSGQEIALILAPLKEYEQNQEPSKASSAGTKLHRLTSYRLSRAIDQLQARIDSRLSNTESNGVPVFIALARDLKRRFEAEVLPLRNDLDSFIDYLATYDNPTEFQSKVRSVIISLFNTPEKHIIFAPSPDPIVGSIPWLFAQESPEHTAVHLTISDNSGRVERILLIPSDNIGDFLALACTIHEAIHAQQSLGFLRRRSEPLFFILGEAYAEYMTRVHLLSLAQQGPLASDIRKVADEAFEETGFGVVGFMRDIIKERKPDSLEEQIWVLTSALPYFASYIHENDFLVRLLGHVDLDAITACCVDGNIKALRDSLGHNKFDALRLFFNKWNSALFARALTQGYRVADSLSVEIADSFVLAQEKFPRSRIPRLLEFVDMVNESVQQLAGKKADLIELRMLFSNLIETVFIPRGIDFMNGELTQAELADILNSAMLEIYIAHDTRSAEPSKKTSSAGKKLFTDQKIAYVTKHIEYLKEVFGSYSRDGILSKEGAELLEKAQPDYSTKPGELPYNDLYEAIRYFRGIPHMQQDTILSRFPQRFFNRVSIPDFFDHESIGVNPAQCKSNCAFCPVPNETKNMPFPVLVMLARDYPDRLLTDLWNYDPLYYHDVSGAVFTDVAKVFAIEKIITHGYVERGKAIAMKNLRRINSSPVKSVALSVHCTDLDYFLWKKAGKTDIEIADLYLKRYRSIIALLSSPKILIRFYAPAPLSVTDPHMQSWRKISEILEKAIRKDASKNKRLLIDSVAGLEVLSPRAYRHAAQEQTAREMAWEQVFIDRVSFSDPIRYSIGTDGMLSALLDPQYEYPEKLSRELLGAAPDGDLSRTAIDATVDKILYNIEYRELLVYLYKARGESYPLFEEALFDDASGLDREDAHKIVTEFLIPRNWPISISRIDTSYLVDLPPSYKKVPIASILQKKETTHHTKASSAGNERTALMDTAEAYFRGNAGIQPFKQLLSAVVEHESVAISVGEALFRELRNKNRIDSAA